MHRLETSIDISASAERIWSLLMDFPAYGSWNPFIRSISGSATTGHSLDVFIQPPGSGGMRFRPEILKNEPSGELRWQGKLWVKGLFDGEHYFKLEPKPSGGVVFHHGEIFTGLLVPLFRNSLNGATKRGFIAMNEALKREAEKNER